MLNKMNKWSTKVLLFAIYLLVMLKKTTLWLLFKMLEWQSAGDRCSSFPCPLRALCCPGPALQLCLLSPVPGRSWIFQLWHLTVGWSCEIPPGQDWRHLEKISVEGCCQQHLAANFRDYNEAIFKWSSSVIAVQIFHLKMHFQWKQWWLCLLM